MKNLEEVLTQYMKTTQNYVESISENHKETQRNTEAWIKNLETQIRQISTQLANMSSTGVRGLDWFGFGRKNYLIQSFQFCYLFTN